MGKNTLHKFNFKRSIILIMILAMITSSLCGCSMIFGETLPEDEERMTMTGNGLSYEVPESYVTQTIQSSNGATINAWVNDPENIEFYFAFTTISTDYIDLNTYNWFSTGYFSGQVTYMGQTLTLSPNIMNPSVRYSDEIEINGNKGFKTKVVYDRKDIGGDKVSSHTEIIYIIQFGNNIASIVFETKTSELSKYEPLIDIIINSFKLA